MESMRADGRRVACGALASEPHAERVTRRGELQLMGPDCRRLRVQREVGIGQVRRRHELDAAAPWTRGGGVDLRERRAWG